MSAFSLGEQDVGPTANEMSAPKKSPRGGILPPKGSKVKKYRGDR